jgi:Bacterial regulatory proteins, tetR family
VVTRRAATAVADRVRHGLVLVAGYMSGPVERLLLHALDSTVHPFNNLNVSSERADLTTAAAIRIAAMELFAERGYAAVTIRQIASAAGVSPALVIHHYGSKDKLRALLEERAVAFVESMLDVYAHGLFVLPAAPAAEDTPANEGQGGAG